VTVHDPSTGVDRFVVVPASYVFLLRDGVTATEVLLQLRQNTGYMDDHWAAAALHVAGHREAREELAVSDLVLEFLTTMQRTAHDLPIDERVDFFFACRSWQGEPTITEPAKCADLRWFPLDRLPQPVVPHELVVLEGLRDGTLPPLTSFGF